MQFSLIMATIGRTAEVDNALKSFSQQSFKDFEVIIIDQNPKGYLENIIDKHKGLKIKYVHTTKKGLSKARNIGIEIAKGNIIAFPDDDCEYDKETLINVNKYLSKSQTDILNVKVIDKNTKVISAGGDYTQERIITRNNIHKACSVALFFRKSVIHKVGLFDEELGAGTDYGSGEETDYLFRALYNGFQITYTPKIIVFHPEEQTDTENISQRSKSYGKGWGHLFKKHSFRYKRLYSFILYNKYLAGALVLSGINIAKLDKYKSKKYWNIFKGMFEGFNK